MVVKNEIRHQGQRLLIVSIEDKKAKAKKAARGLQVSKIVRLSRPRRFAVYGVR